MRDSTTFSLMEGKVEGLPVVAMIREGLQNCETKRRVEHPFGPPCGFRAKPIRIPG